MGILPLIVERDIARQRLQQCAAFAEPGGAMIDVGAHDSRPRNETTPGPEILADSVEQVSQAKLLAISSKDSFPQRRVAADTRRPVEALGALERRAIDVAEDDTAIDVGNAVVIFAEYPVGVRHSNA